MDEWTPDSHATERSPTERLAAAFARHSSQFRKAAKRVRAGGDPEAVHDLRVTARRLVAMLQVWEHGPDALTSIRRLRRLRRQLGVVRELEVHVDLLERRLAQHGPPVAAVLARLRQRLDRRRRRAIERVRGKRVRRITRSLDRVLATIESAASLDAATLAAAHRFERERAMDARRAVTAALASEADVALHQARLTIKKWRYAIECILLAAPEPPATDLTGLREIQEVLGEIQDRATLREALDQASAKLPTKSLEPLIEELRDEETPLRSKFRALVHAWQEEARRDPAPAAGAAAAVDREERWDRMANWLAGARPAAPETRLETRTGASREGAPVRALRRDDD